MRKALLPCAACKGELPDHDHICESCAVKVCCDCASNCHDCGTDICPKHVRSCDHCEEVTCQGCLMKCDGCKTHACYDCRVVCAECDKVFCEDCQDDYDIETCDSCDKTVCGECRDAHKFHEIRKCCMCDDQICVECCGDLVSVSSLDKPIRECAAPRHAMHATRALSARTLTGRRLRARRLPHLARIVELEQKAIARRCSEVDKTSMPAFGVSVCKHHGPNIFVPSEHAYLACASCAGDKYHYHYCPRHAAEHEASCSKRSRVFGYDNPISFDKCVMTAGFSDSVMYIGMLHMLGARNGGEVFERMCGRIEGDVRLKELQKRREQRKGKGKAAADAAAPAPPAGREAEARAERAARGLTAPLACPATPRSPSR